MKYKCIIFDCDGVLVDSETIGNQVLVDLANQYGAQIDIAYAFKHFKGNAMENCHQHIKAITTKPLPDNFVETYRTQSFEAFRKGIKPIQGVKQVIEHLKIPFCVASSGPEQKIRLNLDITDLLPYFENNIFSCYTIQKWKPEPDIFLWAAQSMGFEPKDCLVIEDSVIGVNAALKGGFDVFGYTAHDFNNELEGLATRTFNDMNMLLKTF